MADASPAKWHLAHTSWFFETFVLRPYVADYHEFCPAFRVLFNSYYNGVGDRHPRSRRGLLSRPSLAEVHVYRGHVDAAIGQWLSAAPIAPEALERLELGLQHEQQHQELILTDIKHMLSCDPLQPAYRAHGALAPAASASKPRWVEFAEGVTEIGHRGVGFAFDNESPRHRQYLDAFALASRLVTNGEYLAFMADGGYTRPELWLSEGWDWVNANEIESPVYWRSQGREWSEFTLHGLQPVIDDVPVCHINFFEADAYARWAGARLPTEAEWEVAAAPVQPRGNFLEDGWLHPRPTAHDAAPLLQLYGDAWEWSQSSYGPYPGYRPAPGAIGEYNGKFMCNQYVLRGGSCATPQSHVRATYRNFFPVTARWQVTGLRLARDLH